jgi:hypothetical protein
METLLSFLEVGQACSCLLQLFAAAHASRPGKPACMLMQTEDEGYVRMLPSTSCTLKVSFYAASCESLSASHPVVAVSWHAGVHLAASCARVGVAGVDAPCPCAEVGLPRLQALTRVCRSPRNGIYSASTARLAMAAQQTPGMAMQVPHLPKLPCH